MDDRDFKELIEWKGKLIAANDQIISLLDGKVALLKEVLKLRTEIVRLKEATYEAAEFEVKDYISGNTIRLADTLAFRRAMSEPPEEANAEA